MALLDFFKNKRSSDRALTRREEAFDKNKKTVEKDVPASVKLAEKNELSGRAFEILNAPHFTEKSGLLNESGAYVFKVFENVNKPQIKHAIEDLYGVKVRKVNIIASRDKKLWSRGKAGKKSGFKKAVVSLEKGHKIELI